MAASPPTLGASPATAADDIPGRDFSSWFSEFNRTGQPPVNLRTGVWSDFATDDKGGDLIGLLHEFQLLIL